MTGILKKSEDTATLHRENMEKCQFIDSFIREYGPKARIRTAQQPRRVVIKELDDKIKDDFGL